MTDITDADVVDTLRVLKEMLERGGNTSFWVQIIGGKHLSRGYHLDPVYPMLEFDGLGRIIPSYIEYGGGHNEYTTDAERNEVLAIAAELLYRARQML